MEPGLARPRTKPDEQRRKRRFDKQFVVFEKRAYTARLRYGFEKWSDSAFPAMFGISADEGKIGSDENPIQLPCTIAEFESLLEVIYPASDGPTATLDKDEWIGVLKLSRLWNMPQLAVRAMEETSPGLSPIEKITLGKASALQVPAWVREGYMAIIGDLNEMTLEGLAADVGWETTARILWALKRVSFKYHPALADLSTGDVVDEIVGNEFGGEELAEAEAGLHSTSLEGLPNSLRITVTQDRPVPRRAGTASIITFAPDGVYVSRGYAEPPIHVLRDFGYDTAGWSVEKDLRLVGDTTGNGCSDIIGFSSAEVYISRNNGDDTFSPPNLVISDFGNEEGYRGERDLRYAVDLRRKGFVDIIGFAHDGVYVALNDGDGNFSSPTIVLSDFGHDAGDWWLDRHLRFLADVTGNGFPDIVGFGESSVMVALNNGDGTFQDSRVAMRHFTPGAGRWLVEKHPRTVADLTGDGRADIVGFFDDGVYVALSAGDGSFHPPELAVKEFGYSQGWQVEKYPRFVADITGDGRGDIVGFGHSDIFVALNNGDGTFKPTRSLVNGFGEGQGWRVGKHLRLPVDLTGDGAADILGFKEDGVWVSYNDGNGNFGPVQRLRDGSSGDANSPIEKTVRWVTNLYA